MMILGAKLSDFRVNNVRDTQLGLLNVFVCVSAILESDYNIGTSRRELGKTISCAHDYCPGTTPVQVGGGGESRFAFFIPSHRLREYVAYVCPRSCSKSLRHKLDE